MAASYSTVYPLLGEHPSCRDSWSGNVCMQTSRNTCSAASAATLLKFAGIEASESEMAELCLTRRGTTWAGLYRGLKQKTAGTGWDVEIFDATIDDLRASRQPVLLSVGLKETPRASEDYVNDWGWVPGQSHSVVLLNFLGRDTVVIGDPAVGRELWSVKDLAVLWQGEGIRLVRNPVGHQLAQRHFE
jgi:ABC-type bacteriocin/lantibiotic exporter with double-glycine peptidase domain